MRELLLAKCRLEKRYDIERKLGQGSYAEVFVARDGLAAPSSPHSHVVIKALNVFLQDDLDPDLERTLVENFQNEAIALDRVRHPNIISRLGHGTARDLRGTIFHYIVLEYLAGGDLQKLVRGQGLPRDKAFFYLEQICAGLKHAHKQSVIHRDIKPQNLLLSRDLQTVKIADFGVARIHAGDAPITRVGTNIYAPPEHSPLAAEAGSLPAAALKPAADVYSLAKTFYAMLTSEAPRAFAGRQITDLPITVRNEPWASDLLEVLQRATSDDPAERHASVDDLWLDLAKVRGRLGVEETITVARPKPYIPPQSRPALGYSPIAPVAPRFDTSRELKIGKSVIGMATPQAAGELHQPIDKSVRRPAAPTDTRGNFETGPHANIEQPRRKSVVRRLAAYVLLIIVFAGALYGTSAYLRGIGLRPFITKALGERTGRANTDINLRPEPSVNNDPIGLVTRNSRVRVVKAQDNWYQVDILEQGRTRSDAPNVTRGWINGRYIDLDQD